MNKLGIRPKKMFTSGQLAMTFFKTWCRKQPYKNSNYSAYLYKRGTIHRSKFHGFIRKALRGARCECFNQGVYPDFTMIDLNSLYPHVMANVMRMPDLLSERFYKDPEDIFTQEEILEKIGVAKATVIFPKKKLGYLPVRYNNGIFFPQNTRVTGYWTLFELQRAKEEGYSIEHIHEMVVYRELPFNPFSEFMTSLYELRKNSDEVFNHVIKLLMNSLAGKFAQYREEKVRKICHREDSEGFEGKGYEIENSYGEDYYMVKSMGRKVPKFAHPMITIMVKAYARDVLYKNLKKVADENFEDLLYCDTDSVAFKGDYLDKFEIGKELGQFKVVYKNKVGAFVREKIYGVEEPDGTPIRYVFAGNTNKNITQKHLWGEEAVSNKKMYSLNMGFRTGNFEKVGTFFETMIKTDPFKRKRTVVFPNEYIEVAKEEGSRADD